MSEPRHHENELSAIASAEPPTDGQYLAVAGLIRANALHPDDETLLLDVLLGPASTPRRSRGEHNPAHYSAGCRHPECIAANTAYQRDRAAGRIPKYTGGAS